MGLFGGSDDKKKDKPKPDFSNVQSGSSSTARPPVEPATAFKTYVVQKGDSLSKIAKAEYGKASDWRKIFEANRDIIKNPDLIHPGQSLKIPPA